MHEHPLTCLCVWFSPLGVAMTPLLQLLQSETRQSQEAQRKQEVESVPQEVPRTEEDDVIDEDVLAVTEREDQRSDLRGQISVTDSSTRKRKILPKTKEKLVLVTETEPALFTPQEKYEAEKSAEIFVLKMESEAHSDNQLEKTQSQIKDVQFVPLQTETKVLIKTETRKQAEISQEKQTETKTTPAEPEPVQTRPALIIEELKASVRPETIFQQPEVSSEESVTDIESRRLVKVQQKSEHQRSVGDSAKRLRTEDLKPSDLLEPEEEVSAGRGIRVSVRTLQGFTSL